MTVGIGSRAPNGKASAEVLAPLGLTPHMAAARRAHRINVRLLGGVLLVAVAFSGFVLFVTSTAPATRAVLVATRDLPAGTKLRRADLAVTTAQLGEGQARIAVGADALDQIEGRALDAPLFTQQILVQPQLATTGKGGLEPGFVKVSVPVRPDNAVGGQIRPGDEVTVLSTRDKGKVTSDTRAVLERVIVDEVGRGDPAFPAGGPPSLSGGDPDNPGSRPGRAVSWVVLVIPEDRAASLSQARWNGELDVILLPSSRARGAQ